MKTFKRIISVILAAAIMMSCFAFAVYAEGEDENEIVANVYLCHRIVEKLDEGHAWLYFENLTDHDLMVGKYILPPGEGVSVGTYSGGDTPDGRGVYYNVEAYRYGKYNHTDNVYLQKELTQKQLDRMSSKINRSNYWTRLTNCSFFSITTWDIVAGKPVLYLFFPLFTRWQIQYYPGHHEGLKMYFPRKDQIFKHQGFGSNSTIKPSYAYK